MELQPFMELQAEDKIREGIEPLSKAANLFLKLKR